MKNFSDLLATNDTDIAVHVRIRAISDNGDPYCYVTVNQHVLYDGLMSGKFDLDSRVKLTDNILIQIGMKDKKYSAEKETAIVIESILIDGHEMIPAFTHLSHYENEREHTGFVSTLGFNGTWKLSIDAPFYQWYHRASNQGWLLEPT